MLEISERIRISEDELTERAIRASGPGGPLPRRSAPYHGRTLT